MSDELSINLQGGYIKNIRKKILIKMVAPV